MNTGPTRPKAVKRKPPTADMVLRTGSEVEQALNLAQTLLCGFVLKREIHATEDLFAPIHKLLDQAIADGKERAWAARP